MVVRISLVVILAVAAGGCEAEGNRSNSKAEAILTRAAEYLWERQGADGGWHSELHGVMRTGQSLTPYLLMALTEVPERLIGGQDDGVERALDFIRNHVNEQGILGLSDSDIIEYPNYSTAYALRALLRHGEAADSGLIRQMTRYLVAEQFTEARGIGPDHPAYGAWGFGETNLAKGQVGHVDLSHTRHVLEAIADADAGDSAHFRKATRFLRLLQKHPLHEQSVKGTYDGGFYFSPVVLDQNKAGRDEEAFRSYATATCGGLMALLVTGHSLEDEPVKGATKWLEENPELDYPAGIPEDDPDQWRKVLFFYHLSVRAEAYRAVGMKGEWREEMVRLIGERQRQDGSFANPYGSPNKEDDPLLATALVIRTLTNLLQTNP
ncbi:MAG TPA: prenyltransferase/squalene oxidase repeat-containing protein [Bacteroidota bacterium]